MLALRLAAGVVSIVVLTGWTARDTVVVPRHCTAVDTRQRAVLITGNQPGGHAYTRICGPARAVVRVRGTSYAIQGGSCAQVSDPRRWIYFGLIQSGGLPGARGLSLVLEPGNRPGRVKIIDSIVQVEGLDLAPRGTAVLSDDLKSGTFVGKWAGTRVSGSWNCAAGAFGRVHPRLLGG